MSYRATDIEVLEGLEPVRKRPGMYIGGTDQQGFHHLLWEIIDNSVDEGINGFASVIEVELDADLRGATVSDDGRGIPVDIHPQHGLPALELIFTTLHAGGKFGGANYAVSGGLHGVGSSVVNALSEKLVAQVQRDGGAFEQTFVRGVPTTQLQRIGNSRKHGTQVWFQPDAQIFGTKAKFDLQRIRDRLEAKSYLHQGLRFVLKNRATGASEEFFHPQGLVEYLGALLTHRSAMPVHPEAFSLRHEGDPRLEVALQWTDGTDETIRTFANGIPTPSGGTHEQGFKLALTRAVRSFASDHKLVPRGLSIAAEDVREGLVALVSVFVSEPQFQGQTKERLNNAELSAKVENIVREALEQWLHNNRSVAEAVVARVLMAARAREASRAASQQVVRKGALRNRLNLPGKLADCSHTKPEHCELFLVEGDSAGGNAKQGRDRRFQAILPLRGKVLNAERASMSAVSNNRELQDVVQALGCSVGNDFNLSNLRYHKVILLMDADTDGNHITTLLLTFLYRLLPRLVHQGHVYLAQPPLFRIDLGTQTHWAQDESEKEKILRTLKGKPEISRFKGLGEMTAEELRLTTLDPRTRRLLRVEPDDPGIVHATLQTLMGKDPAPRYRFITENAAFAESEALDV